MDDGMRNWLEQQVGSLSKEQYSMTIDMMVDDISKQKPFTRETILQAVDLFPLFLRMQSVLPICARMAVRITENQQ